MAASADLPVLAQAIPGGLGEGAEGLLGPSVQLKGGAGEAAAAVHEAASAGIQDPGGSLPFLDVIQPAFGDHDVTGIRAHTGPEASTAAQQIGAAAYGTGDDIAFAGAPDLHTTAHEAAHVQQRVGVHLEGGVGEAGDAYEREADAVADRVVAGESAARNLDRYGPLSATSSGVAVQR